MKQGQLESVDGLSYLISLDEGLPELANLDSYVRIVKDKATLRKLIFNAQKIINRCLIGEEEPDEILAAAEESLLKLGEARTRDRADARPPASSRSFPGGVNAFLDPSQRVRGLSTGFAKFDEMTGGLHGGELFILAARPSMGKTALALNIAQHVATHPKNAQAGGRVLARNVVVEPADAPAVLGRARGSAQIPRRISESGGAAQAAGGAGGSDRIAAVPGRHARA